MGSFTQQSTSETEPRHGRTSAWSSTPESIPETDELRLAVLLRATEHEIIPRLMIAHRGPAECVAVRASTGQAVTEADVELFTRLVLSPDESLAEACIQAMRTQGVAVEAICIDLLGPVARRLGVLWEQDLCDFSEVTFGLGRLQQVLRELSPAFDQASGSPANGSSILLVPSPGEQHTFGLVMVAEFFRRAGWDVEPILGDDSFDPVEAVRREWYDVIGFSLAAEIHLDDLGACIARVRAASLNPALGIMVGGPLFARQPEQVERIGADASAGNGREAPALADRLVADRKHLTRPPGT